jgi:hypothetical protein
MKIEGALCKRFLRHDGIYRSDVSSLLLTLGRSRFPVGSVPGYRTSRKEHALPIVRDEFRPAIPRRVALQCGAHAMGQNAEGTRRDNGEPGSAAVGRQCSGAHSSPFVQCGPGLRGQNSGDASLPARARKRSRLGDCLIFTTRTPILGNRHLRGLTCRERELAKETLPFLS